MRIAHSRYYGIDEEYSYKASHPRRVSQDSFTVLRVLIWPVGGEDGKVVSHGTDREYSYDASRDSIYSTEGIDRASDGEDGKVSHGTGREYSYDASQDSIYSIDRASDGEDGKVVSHGTDREYSYEVSHHGRASTCTSPDSIYSTEGINRASDGEDGKASHMHGTDSYEVSHQGKASRGSIYNYSSEGISDDDEETSHGSDREYSYEASHQGRASPDSIYSTEGISHNDNGIGCRDSISSENIGYQYNINGRASKDNMYGYDCGASESMPAEIDVNTSGDADREMLPLNEIIPFYHFSREWFEKVKI